MSILLIVPSRGRPGRAAKFVRSVRRTATGPVDIVLVVDADDESLGRYVSDVAAELVVVERRLGYTGSLNLVARERWDRYEVLGAFGDDVVFRTHGWDPLVSEVLARPGIAYGNDLVHSQGHPTAVWMSSSIARALGWLALPWSWHLWVDDAWKRLGTETGTLRYLPDVIVEHEHPAVGKAREDRTYREVYDGPRAHEDHLGFLRWEQYQLAIDVEKVREVTGA